MDFLVIMGFLVEIHRSIFLVFFSLPYLDYLTGSSLLLRQGTVTFIQDKEFIQFMFFFKISLAANSFSLFQDFPGGVIIPTRIYKFPHLSVNYFL